MTAPSFAWVTTRPQVAARVLPYAALLFLVAACKPGADKDASERKAADESAAARARVPVQSYVPAESLTTGIGSFAVAVTVPPEAPEDTVVFPIRDFEVCGSSLTDNSIDRDGQALGGALVWLSGVTAGKVLPVRKRFDITHRGCLLSPRVQAVTAGGTLNIRNMDPAVHVLRFSDATTGETLARITQSETGQVVPNEYLLDVPRVLEVSCESHPWTKAWIHVFDHPYHAITGKTGAALLDSVPSGSYQFVVWHERFGEQRSDVKIETGARATSGVMLGGVRE